MAKNYKQTYLFLWLLLAVALAVVCAISFTEDGKIAGVQLTKGTFPDVILAPELTEEEKAEIAAAEKEDFQEERVVTADPDTTVKTVLIFGDSMTILVANRLAAYGEKNGYRVASVTWDGSSTVSWSSCDTLDNFIARYHPDFIMVTLGSNELFLKNFDSRRPYVEKIVEKIGNIPFVWISPPNWKEDVGFNAMMRRTLPKGTFYNSNHLDLPRGADHIHPTPKGGIIWTDSIMAWMPFTPHPIPFEKPSPKVGTRAHLSHYFKAGKGGRSDAKGGAESGMEESGEMAPPEEPKVSEPEHETGSAEHPAAPVKAEEPTQPAAAPEHVTSQPEEP